MRYVPIALHWRALRLGGHRDCNGFAGDVEAARRIERKLERVLGEWKDTPYAKDDCTKKRGTFCVAFVVSVLDELYGRATGEPPPGMPFDTCFHDRERALGGLRWFLRRYPEHERVEDGYVEPGDVLVTEPAGGGPGHAILVGPRENTLWQATEAAGVHFTGMALPEQWSLHCAYRITDKHLWLRS